MTRIYLRWIVWASLPFLALLQTQAAKPNRLPTDKAESGKAIFGGAEYLSVVEVGRRLGLQLTWVERPRKVVLQSATTRAELEADSRPAKVNGLRVYLGHRVLASAGQLYISQVDFERCLTPLLQPGFGVALPAPLHVVAIDAGHGGIDCGTGNQKARILEKDVALDVAKRLEKRLTALGYKVVMTRTKDRLLAPKPEDLRRRAEIANQARVDLFISIHFNAVLKDAQATRGVEVYTYAPATQHSTDSWSESDKDDADFLTTEQPGNRFDHWNSVLAEALHHQLLDALKTDDRGKKIMHLGVLRWLNCPAVLVEPAFLTNDAEATQVAKPEFRQQIADALAAGISHYAAILESLRAKEPANGPL